MKTPLIIALVCSSFATSAYAGQKSHHSRYDYARVTQVTPIVEVVNKRTPRQICQRVSVKKSGQRSHTPLILGGLIGGAIGNELGHHKSSQRVGAVAGSILGASIANDLGRGSARPTYHTEQRCHTEYDIEQVENVVGYDVSYRYRGKIYQTHMNHRPGKKLKLRVRFSPVDY